MAAEHEDPQWLSLTQLLFSKYAESSPHIFKIMDINPNNDQVVSTVRDWYSDSLFTPTPCRSYTVTRDGGVVYLQGTARLNGAYLRIVPNWVEHMKRAVDEANR